jgi:adenosylhomocysteine nucleosidase
MNLLIVALPEEFQLPLPLNWQIIYSGVGKVNAAIATVSAIRDYQPSFIINYGTVGSLNNSLTGLHEVGNFCQRDMITLPKSPRGITPFGNNDLYISNGRSNIRCGTGDSFVLDREDWLVEHCDVVDMEGYSIVKSANEYNIPWQSFKYITDFTSADGFNDWQSNVANGQKEFLKILETINANTHVR